VTPPLQVVWFKRDLRVEDHRPLALAARAGPVLPLYIVEPGLWAQPDASGRQWAFASECLEELAARLDPLGQPLCVEVGEAPVEPRRDRQRLDLRPRPRRERLGAEGRDPLARGTTVRRHPPAEVPERVGAGLGPRHVPASDAAAQ